MKNTFAIFALFLLLLGCSKEGSDGPGTYSQVKIRGHFSITKALPVDPSTATQVVLFNSNGNYSTSPVVSGAFSVQVNKDEPVGLIFTNGDKKFLGYLSLGQGIESLPLNYLNDTVSTIDLGLLQVSSEQVSAQTNLLQGKMNLTSDQIKSYRQASVNFSALVKNPDTDKNGIIDLLEGKYYHLSFLYFGEGDHFTTTPRKEIGITPAGFRVMFMTNDSDTPATVTFSSLDGSMTLGTNQKKIVSGTTIYFSEMINQYSTQVTQCKILYKDKELFFDIPDQSGTLSNSVFVFPTMHYEGTNLKKISWQYYSGISGGSIDAGKIILNVMAQVSGNDYSVRLYDSQNYGPETTEVVLSTSIPLSNIGVVNMAYNDIFGNSVAIGYKHP